jgi:hypothetical protein
VNLSSAGREDFASILLVHDFAAVRILLPWSLSSFFLSRSFLREDSAVQLGFSRSVFHVPSIMCLLSFCCAFYRFAASR